MNVRLKKTEQKSIDNYMTVGDKAVQLKDNRFSNQQFKKTKQLMKKSDAHFGKSILQQNPVFKQEVMQAGDGWKTNKLKKEHDKAKEYPDSLLMSGLKSLGTGGVMGTVAMGGAFLASLPVLTSGAIGLGLGGLGYGAYNYFNRKEHKDERHTLHHKMAKSKLENHYDSLSPEEQLKMKTAMGLDSDSGKKAIKSFVPNLTLGREPQSRSIKDPGSDFDGNTLDSGKYSPRSSRLKKVETLVDSGSTDYGTINTHLKESLSEHEKKGFGKFELDTKTNKTKLDTNVKTKIG